MDSAVSRSPGSTADRGQSNVIGLVLVLGMVMIGIGLVVALGAAALDSTQQQSELERAEHSMTLLNSRTSMVALGDSESQQVSFGQDGGEFEAETDSGWIRIKHANYTTNGDDEVMFNESLGAIVYRNGGTEIAYQGGGVWRKDRQGDARMVSPPEFHYRGATLTLPIIRVNDAASDSGTGGSKVSVSRVDETHRVFPNTTAETVGDDEIGAPYNGTDRQYHNPVANGTVNITVQSEYYKGWAEYFRDHTDGEVTEFPNDNRVRVTLESLAGSIGNFNMPAEGNSLKIRGMESDHPLNTFTLTLKRNVNFNGGHWSLYADEGNEEFEFHVYSPGQCTGAGAGTYNKEFDVSIYYRNTSAGNTIHEEWQNQSIDPYANDDFDIDCADGTLDIDLLGTDTTLEYGDVDTTGNSNKWEYGSFLKQSPSNDPPSTTTSLTHHNSDNGDVPAPTKEELGYLTNHYFTMMGPRFDLTVTDGPGNSNMVDESASTGDLDFETSAGAQYITFLHITENKVNVTFD